MAVHGEVDPVNSFGPTIGPVVRRT
jgi:hypothetical protein